MFKTADALSFFVVTFNVLNANSFIVAQVPSPAAPLVNSAPLEQTPAEEESRKSISRSFKGTMASSTERKETDTPPPLFFSLTFCFSYDSLYDRSLNRSFSLQHVTTSWPPQLLRNQLWKCSTAASQTCRQVGNMCKYLNTNSACFLFLVWSSVSKKGPAFSQLWLNL